MRTNRRKSPGLTAPIRPPLDLAETNHSTPITHYSLCPKHELPRIWKKIPGSSLISCVEIYDQPYRNHQHASRRSPGVSDCIVNCTKLNLSYRFSISVLVMVDAAHVLSLCLTAIGHISSRRHGKMIYKIDSKSSGSPTINSARGSRITRHRDRDSTKCGQTVTYDIFRSSKQVCM